MTMIGVVGIVFCAILVIVLSYRGLNIIIAAPLCAILLMVFTQLPLVSSFTDTFLNGCASFVSSMFGVYLAGAVLGEIYNASGAASSIARSLMRVLRGKRDRASPIAALLIIFAAGLILAYGGVHVVALAYILLPLSLEIMREAGIPRKMAPGIVMGCICTSALAMPGSPQTQNVTPMSFLGTTSTAALIPGIIGGVLVLLLNLIYLNWTAKRFNLRGIQFDGDNVQPTPEREKYINPWLAAVPLVLIFVLFNFCGLYVVYAIFVGSAVALLIFRKHYGGFQAAPSILGKGGSNCCVVLIAGAVMGGFGAVVSSAPAFQSIAQAVAGFPGPKLIAAAIAIMVIVAVCGSGPAGLATALPMFRDTFTAMGLNFSALHRVASFAGTTLDSLPTNAIYIAMSSLTGVTIRESYKYVFVTTVVNTSIATFAVAALCTLFPGLV